MDEGNYHYDVGKYVNEFCVPVIQKKAPVYGVCHKLLPKILRNHVRVYPSISMAHLSYINMQY